MLLALGGVFFFFFFFLFATLTLHYPTRLEPFGVTRSHFLASQRRRQGRGTISGGRGGTLGRNSNNSNSGGGALCSVTPGGRGGWKPSDTFCLLLWLHTPHLQSGPHCKGTVHPVYILFSLPRHLQETNFTRGEEKRSSALQSGKRRR